MLPRHPMLRREARRSIDLSHKATTFTHLLRRRRERWCAYPLPALSRGEGRVRGRVSSHRRRFALTRPLIPPSPRQERGEGAPLAPHHRRRVNLIASTERFRARPLLLISTASRCASLFDDGS